MSKLDEEYIKREIENGLEYRSAFAIFYTPDGEEYSEFKLEYPFKNEIEIAFAISAFVNHVKNAFANRSNKYIYWRRTPTITARADGKVEIWCRVHITDSETSDYGGKYEAEDEHMLEATRARFNKLLDEMTSEEVIACCIVIVDKNNNARADCYGHGASVIMVGALEYAKSMMLRILTPKDET